MSKHVLLEYAFLFDPSEMWSHLYQFEGALAEFFSKRGMEAEIVKSIEGQAGKRVLFLKKIKMAMPKIKATNKMVKDFGKEARKLGKKGK